MRHTALLVTDQGVKKMRKGSEGSEHVFFDLSFEYLHVRRDK